MRLRLLLPAVVLAVLGGLASASIVTGHADGPEEPKPADFDRPSGPGRVVATERGSADDRLWALRTYRSTAGLRCFEIGQQTDGRFGTARPDGTTGERDADEGRASCAPGRASDLQVVVSRYPANGDSGPRAIVVGALEGPGLRVTVQHGGGEEAATIGRDGTFLAVLEGARQQDPIVVRAATTVGLQVRSVP